MLAACSTGSMFDLASTVGDFTRIVTASARGHERTGISITHHVHGRGNPKGMLRSPRQVVITRAAHGVALGADALEVSLEVARGGAGAVEVSAADVVAQVFHGSGAVLSADRLVD